MQKNLLVLIITIFFSMNIEKAESCSCIQNPSPVLAKKNAKAVFTGIVAKKESLGESQQKILFFVEEAWKGLDCFKYYWAVTANSSATCGYTFEKGKRYLVYTTSNVVNGSLEVSLCSRTTPYSSAAFDIKQLRKPYCSVRSKLNHSNGKTTQLVKLAK
jgi:hypothetical protein